MTEPRLRIAAQKNGRLAEPSRGLLEQCGLRFSHSRDQLVCNAENFPVDLMLVRDDDIPDLLAEGMCDLGIVGENTAGEAAPEDRASGFTSLLRLNFGACRLAIAVPGDGKIRTIKNLQGKRIATSYPRLLRRFLQENGLEAHVVTLRGSVEIAPSLGNADAIADLVSTGRTLEANRLRELATVLESKAALYQGERPRSAPVTAIAQRLLCRMEGVLQVRESKYVMLHAPLASLTQITALLPGAESPTVLPLEGENDRVAVHAVCREEVFWEHLEDLRAAGASAVLVLPVEKMLA